MTRRFAQGARTAIVCLLLAAPLAACESFDPSSITDLIPDSKKKLPGERKEVFPQGVPGVSQGVPRELVRGNQPADASALAAPEQPAEPQEPKVEEKPKPKPKPKTATNRTRPPASVAPEQAQQQQPQQQSPWPSQPAQQQQQPQAAWPAPPPAQR